MTKIYKNNAKIVINMIVVLSILDKLTISQTFLQLGIFLKFISLLNGYLDIHFYNVTVTIIRCIK